MWPKTALVLLFVATIFLRTLYIVFAPIGSNPDEPTRFGRVYYTALKIRYPELVESHIPNHTFYYSPLYFWIAGLFLSPFINLPLLPTWQALQVFGVHLRLLSLFFSLTAMISTLYLFKKLYPQLLLLSSLFLLFFPQWTASSVWISMDSLFLFITVIIAIVAISQLSSIYKHKSPILLGILTGLAILIKPFGFSVVIGVLAGILASWKWRGKKLLASTIYILTSLLMPSFWFWNNWNLTGDPLSLSTLNQDVISFTKPFTFPFYPLGVFWWTIETFIASFGPTNNIRLPIVLYLIIAMIIFYLIKIFIKRKLWRQLVKNEKQRLFILILTVMTIGSLVHFIFINTFISFQPQGRYLFPLFLLFPIIIAAALDQVFRKHNKTILVYLLTGFLLLINLLGINCISGRYWNKELLPTKYFCVYHRVKLPDWKEPIIFK